MKIEKKKMTLREEFENELVIMGFTGEKQIYTNDFGRIYINWLETKLISLSQHDVIKNEVAVCGKCIGRGSIVIYDTCLDCDKCGGTGTQTVL